MFRVSARKVKTCFGFAEQKKQLLNMNNLSFRGRRNEYFN